MSDLESRDEKMVLVCSIRAKDADKDTDDILSNDVQTHSEDEDCHGSSKSLDIEQTTEGEGRNESENDLNEVRRSKLWKVPCIP